MRNKTTNILQLANTVRQNIQIEKLVTSHYDNLLITFSGGQDSTFCLLVLYLLNTQIRKQWNCKKILDLSDCYNKKKTFIRQTFNPSLALSGCRHGKQNIFYLSQTRTLSLSPTRFLFDVKSSHIQALVKASLYPNLIPYCNINANFLTFTHELRKCSFVRSFSKKEKANIKQNYIFLKKNKLIYNQITELIASYTLLWCNHFWQKDTFFTMEHVFKLSFSKRYTMHSFAPVKEILSEQNARHWRHKVMQRLSLFTFKRHYQFVDLSLNYVFITAPFLLTRSLQNKVLDRNKVINKGVIRTTLLPLQEQRRVKKNNVSFNNYVFVTGNKQVYVKTLSSHRIQKHSFCKDHLNKAEIPLGFDGSQASVSCLSEQLCVQGHNKSDRAETILFNLIRGTGINGLSTLQWKHTSFPPSNSNSKFYPIFSDFFKEIQIIYLNSLFIKASFLQKDRLQTKESVLPKSLLDRDLSIKSNKIKLAKSLYKSHKTNLKESKLILFSENSMVRTKQSYNKTRLNLVVSKASESCLIPLQKQVKPFYYQLKYNKTI